MSQISKRSSVGIPTFHQKATTSESCRRQRGSSQMFIPNPWIQTIPTALKTVPLIHCPSVIERPKMALAVVYSSSSGSSLHRIHVENGFRIRICWKCHQLQDKYDRNAKKMYERSRHTLTLHVYSLFITVHHSWAIPWHPWLCGTSKDHQWTTSPEQLGQLADCPENSAPSRSPTLRPRWTKSEKGLLVIWREQRKREHREQWTPRRLTPRASNWVMMRWWHSTRKALKWSLNEVSERLQYKKQCIYQIINKYTNIPPLQVQTSQLLQHCPHLHQEKHLGFQPSERGHCSIKATQKSQSAWWSTSTWLLGIHCRRPFTTALCWTGHI